MKTLMLTLLLLFLLSTRLTAQTENNLELVFEDKENQFVGVAVSKNGRIFVNYPYWNEQPPNSVIEVLKDGNIKPFPSAEWNSWKTGDEGTNKYVCVQSVYVDDEDNLWIVDTGNPRMEGVYKNSQKVIKFDLETDQPEKIYNFEHITGPHSYINDIRVDTKNKMAYLTNSSEGSLIVLNLISGGGKEILKNHESTMSDPNYVFTVNGKELKDDKGNNVKIHSDGIALSKDFEYIYYKPLTDDRLFRIQTAGFRENNMYDHDYSGMVTDLGRVSTSDGMIIDKDNYIYMGDIENSRIIRYNPTTNVKDVLVTDPKLSWPDSYSISPDGYLYVTTSHIHMMPKYNNGENKRYRPYQIYRINLANYD